jgi:putative phage-type endonuclease
MNFVTTPYVQGTEAWLAARRGGIGSSDIAMIAGESPYRSALELWAEKTGRVVAEPDAETAELFEIGHLMEPPLRAIYERRTGRHVTRMPRMLAHAEIPWAFASLDGRAPVRRAVEAKWSNATRWHGEGIPDDVLCQVQWQLFVTGWDVADVVALVGRSPRVVEVPRDQTFIDNLYRLAVEFQGDVDSDTPPEPDGSESARKTIARLHPVDDGTYLPATPDLVELVDLFRSAKTAKTTAEDAEKGIGNALRAVIADAAGIEGLCTLRKSADSSRVNWPAVASAYRALLDDLAGVDCAHLRQAQRERAIDDLDAVQSIHSETKQGPRPLLLSKEKA